MPSVVARWGNSLAVRLPREIAETANLTDGVRVNISVKGERVILESVRPRYELSDLLAQMKPEHRRAEFDWGTPSGGEVW